MSAISYSKSLEVKHDVDVCVAGAGPAGIAAAVSAARAGRSVFVADAHSMAGGMGTAGLLPVFMRFTDGVNFLAGGIGREIHERGVAAGAIGYDGGDSINAEPLKRIYDEMLTESGATASYMTTLSDVVASNGRVEAAVFSAKSGVFAVKAKVFVDCTGDGDLAAWAGAPFEKGGENGECMPATLCSLWGDVDFDAYRKGGAFSHNDENMLSLLERAFKDGVIDEEDFHHTGMWRRSKHSCGGNLSHCFGTDANDELSLTRSLIRGRKLVAQYEKFYRRYVPGFKDAEIMSTGSLLGVRESRRIAGGYVLNLDDYTKRASFEDEIGRYNFSVDIHPSKTGKEALAEHKRHFLGRHYGNGESYGIPYRILCPRKLENVLTAGRCVSVDRFVMASLRVMPGCFITGMAAGTAAALSASKGVAPAALDVKELQRKLKDAGAYLPNFKD